MLRGRRRDGNDCKEKAWRGWIFPWVSLVYLMLIFGMPTYGCVVAYKLSSRFLLFIVSVLPLLWSVTFIAAAGLLSLPHQSSIVAGKFRRDVSDPLYFHRRLYGLCWTAVYYNKPIYFLCLSVPLLKMLAFRLFGYRGSMKFTVYPDTWIRDLPLLHLEEGVYVSNRATLGTNIVLSNGYLLVQDITLRAKSLVGHLAMLAPGVELQTGAEVAVGCGIGIRTTVGSNAFVGPCSTIEHGVRLGDQSSIGCHSFVGTASTIAAKAKLPPGTIVPPRSRVGDTAEESNLEILRA